MRVGVFGGTFDPPHVGHLIAAQDAIEGLPLDVVLFVPAHVPPHKQHEPVTPAAVRLQMLKAALAGDTRYRISDVELRRAGPSYTVDTLRELHDAASGDQLFLLLGVDQVREFSTWREPSEVQRLARLVMLTRTGIEAVPASGIVHETVAVTRVDISSTLVRQRVTAGRSIRHLVPDAVAQIIAAERLYSGGTG